MPNEVKVLSTLSITTVDGKAIADNDKLTSFDQVGTHVYENVQNVGFAAHELLELGADLAAGTLGYAKFKNLDPTNYVQLGIVIAATFYPVARFYPLRPQTFELEPGAVYYVKSAVAACKLDVKVFEH